MDIKKLEELKKNLEEIELFKDCISTRDSEDDEKEFEKYIRKSLKITNELIKEAKKG